jgi:hypothetical protein
MPPASHGSLHLFQKPARNVGLPHSSVLLITIYLHSCCSSSLVAAIFILSLLPLGQSGCWKRGEGSRCRPPHFQHSPHSPHSNTPTLLRPPLPPPEQPPAAMSGEIASRQSTSNCASAAADVGSAVCCRLPLNPGLPRPAHPLTYSAVRIITSGEGSNQTLANWTPSARRLSICLIAL